jgi:hypothetical protein
MATHAPACSFKCQTIEASSKSTLFSLQSHCRNVTEAILKIMGVTLQQFFRFRSRDVSMRDRELEDDREREDDRVLWVNV